MEFCLYHVLLYHVNVIFYSSDFRGFWWAWVEGRKYSLGHQNFKSSKYSKLRLQSLQHLVFSTLCLQKLESSELQVFRVFRTASSESLALGLQIDFFDFVSESQLCLQKQKSSASGLFLRTYVFRSSALSFFDTVSEFNIRAFWYWFATVQQNMCSVEAELELF